MKRGAIKAFRDYLNHNFGGRVDDPSFQGTPWRNNQYHQAKRAYGDYLYSQDRDMFNENLGRALRGDKQFEGFNFELWATKGE
jgi:hypothetical protein